MPTDEQFLIEYFKETQAEMRRRSDVEYRLLQSILLFYPILGVVFATLYEQILNKGAYFTLSIGATIAIFVITLLIHKKVVAEHDAYKDRGLNVQKVWRYFELNIESAYIQNEKIVEDGSVNSGGGYGSGPGYKKLFILFGRLQ